MHDKTGEVALRVFDDMALAALDFLGGVKAARPAAFRGFHRLAVDDSPPLGSPPVQPFHAPP